MSAYSVSLQGSITGYTKITAAMKQYNALGAVSQKEQQNFATAVALTNTKLGSYLTGLNGAKASLSGYGVSLIASTAKTVGLTIATTALNAALTFGISAIVTGVVSAFATWINSSKKITEAAEEAKDKISSINDDLKTNTETVENAKQRYAELAQEVENLGKVSQSQGSLSTDEYKEFLDLSNQLAGVFPQLTKGYDDNGNAILDLSGSVDTIVGSLNDLLQKEKDLANQKIMDEFPDVYKGYIKDLGDAQAEVKSAQNEFDKIQEAYRNIGNGNSIQMAFNNLGSNTDSDGKITMMGDYESWLDTLGLTYEETVIEGGKLVTAVGDIDTAFTNKLETAKKNLDYAKQQLEGETSSISSYLNTWLQTEFTYNQIDDAGLQTAVQDMVMNFDFSNLPEDVDKDNWNEVSEYLRRNILFAINDIQDDPDISKAISEVFTNQDLTPDEKADYLQQIKDYFDNELGKDNAISISLQPQIDDTDALQKSYENTINRFKDSDKIKDFFDTEGINTDEEINQFNEITKGINDADLAIQKWNEHKKEGNETPISSFEDAWTSLKASTDDDLKGQTDDLLKLAEAGQLTGNALEELAGGQELMKNTGLSVDELAQKINNLVDASTQLTSMSAQISKMSDLLADKKNGETASASDLAGFDVSVRGLDSWDKFEEALGSTESSMDQCQKAANDLATEWINSENFLANLTDENKQYYITQLDQMGVLNSTAVVEQALKNKRAEESAETEYNTAVTEYNTKAKTENEKVTTDLTNATPKEVAEILAESTASKEAKKSMSELYLSKLDINSTKINTQDDVNNIIAIAKAAGTSEQYINKLQGALNKLVNGNTYDNGTKYYDLPFAMTSGKIDYSTGLPTMEELKNQGIKNQAKKTAKDIVKQINDSFTEIKVPDIKIKSTGSSSYKTPSSKNSKTKSQTKSDTSEVFDFIATYLDKVTDKASKAKDKIDELLSFDGKKNQTKKAIEATTKAIKAQEKAYKRYINYANKQATKENNKKTSSSSTTTSTGGQSVYDTATNYLGLKYVWGGASLTNGADCSGFVQQIYKKYGVNLPHHAASQAQMGTKITSKSDLQVGDLVFFGSKNNIKHVGIYGGDGKFIESPHTGASVRISNLSSRKDFVSGSRFDKINGAITTASEGKNVKSVKGVSSKTLEHYKKLIREGTLDSDGIQTISNENLKNALQSYQTWYEKAKACKEQIESLKDQLKDLYETLANNPIDKAASKIEKLGTKIELISSKIANKVVRPNKSSTANAVRNLGNQIVSQYASELKASKEGAHEANVNFNSSKKSTTKAFKKVKAKDIGLTQKQLDTVKKNLKSGKTISQNLIDKMTNTDLIEKCVAYNEYLVAKETAMSDYKQAKEDYVSNKAQAAQDTFDRIAAGYENSLSTYEYKASMAQSRLDAAEKTGHVANQKYYNDLIDITKNQIDYNAREAEELIKTRDAMVKSGDIKKYDDTWYSMSNSIWQCKENVEELTNSVYDYQNALRDLKWEAFTTQEEYINRIPSESEFISSLIDSKDKYDENGNITKYGKTIQGLHAMNANVYQMSALDYEAEIRKLDNDYKNDSLNNDYLKHRQELLESQREAIKNVESERQAIVSLVKDGYDAMKDVLDELIQKRKDALQSEKDLFNYQKSIAQKSQNVAKLRKQLLAYSTDTSEEAKGKIQKLKVSIDDAQQDLKDTEYDKWISDQEELMDNFLSNFQEWIDKRLKDTDSIIKEVVNQTNTSCGEISDTLKQTVGMYGTTLSSKMSEIWDVSSSDINSNIVSGNSSLSGIGTDVNGTKLVISDMWTDWKEGAWLNNESTSTYKAVDSVKDFVSKLYDEPKTDYSTTLTDILDAIKGLGNNEDNKTTDDYGTGYVPPMTTPSRDFSFDDTTSDVSDAVSKANQVASIIAGLPTGTVVPSSNKTSSSSSSSNKSSSSSSSSSNKTSSSSSSSGSSSWASTYLTKKKFAGDKSKLNKNSVVDRLKYYDFDSSMDARKQYYKKLFGGSYSGTSAQNTKLINEMKKHGFKKGGEVGNPVNGKLIKATGEDGLILGRVGEGILTPENMENLRESIKMSNVTLDAINNLNKMPQLKPMSNDFAQSISIGDIQVVANNPQEFAEELRKVISSDVKTQKMFTAFIGNQMMGNNSLDFKKYK